MLEGKNALYPNIAPAARSPTWFPLFDWFVVSVVLVVEVFELFIPEAFEVLPVESILFDVEDVADENATVIVLDWLIEVLSEPVAVNT